MALPTFYQNNYQFLKKNFIQNVYKKAKNNVPISSVKSHSCLKVYKNTHESSTKTF